VITNPKIVRRHVHSVALAAFFRHATPAVYPAARLDVDAFFQPEHENERQGPVLLNQYLRSHPDGVGAALRRIVPGPLQSVLKIGDWGWVDGLVGSDKAVLDRAADLLGDDIRVLNELARKSLDEEKGASHDRFRRIKKTILKRDLLGFLGNSNVLPKYSFPADVVELKTNHVAQAEARDVTLARDLRMALSDYAPGSQVVAGGYLWKSRGVLRRAGRTWDTRYYAVCPVCLSFSRSWEAVPATCSVCSEPIEQPLDGMWGQYIIPEFGFIAAAQAPRRSGETRPPRIYSSRVFFTHDRDIIGGEPGLNASHAQDEDFEKLSRGGVIARYSRHGLLSVVNAGQQARGFRVCEMCGYADPTPLPWDMSLRRRRGRASRPSHQNPLSGRDCSGHLSTYHLGYTFESDVLAVEFPRMMTRNVALSVLYAILEAGSRTLGIQRDDLDGTLYGIGQASQTLILFDDVPGGAGHVRRVGADLDSVLAEALGLVERCACGEETSCYECLRSYRNQFFHQELSRGSARDVLHGVIREAIAR
jgi:hypothetical protein